jgi:hypothetical protein
MKTVLIIGHVTRDVAAGEPPRTGGAVYFAAAAAARLGWRVRCVTRCATGIP